MYSFQPPPLTWVEYICTQELAEVIGSSRPLSREAANGYSSQLESGVRGLGCQLMELLLHMKVRFLSCRPVSARRCSGELNCLLPGWLLSFCSSTQYSSAAAGFALLFTS